MPKPHLLKVFLCHSSADKPSVRDLCHRLSEVSWLDVWLDEEKLYPGQNWNLEIEKAVEDADVILVCLSQASVTKEGYVQREMRIALDYADFKPEGTLYIIPIRLDECDPPRRLRMWQYANYFPEYEREQAFRRLLVSLRKRADGLGISTSVPTPKVDKPVKVEPPAVLLANPQPSVYITGNVMSSTIILGNSNAVTTEKESVAENMHIDSITLDGMEFCRVSAGRFVMGSNDGDDNEKPQQTVDIPYDYWMGRFTVTNEQYGAYAEANGIRHPVIAWEKKADHPVVNVSWGNTNRYCRWLNQRIILLRASAFLSESPVPSNFILRLPTEAEWEKAARGINGNIYPWGNNFDSQKCNSYESGKRTTAPVAAYPKGMSPYGCEQTAGNVWEWTHSLYGKYPYRADDGREDMKKKGARVFRGGSFFYYQPNVRCAYRGGALPTHLNDHLGFRVVISIRL